MRVLLIGGTGAFSSRIAEVASAAGHDVMVATRGRRPLHAGVRPLVVERSELRAHADAIAAFAPGAVVDSICFDRERAADLVDLFPHASRVVFISSVDVYGEDVGAMPVVETRAPQPLTAYARGKAEAERVVLDGLGTRATVFRPSHILGRGFLTTSLWSRSGYLVDRLRKGKPIPAIDGGRNLMTPVHALDAARWVVASFGDARADGEIFNAVGAQTVTQRDYYECIAAILGVKARLVAVPSQAFQRHVASPSQFSWHRPYSSVKVVAALGIRQAATLRSMMEETVRHMLDHGLVQDCSADPFDDRLVETLLRHEDELGSLLASRS